MIKKIYMAVTSDKYELPVDVADTAQELADMRGLTRGSLMTYISKAQSGVKRGEKYIRVEIKTRNRSCGRKLK